MRVLVGFDGSEGAWDAIALGKLLCEFTDGSLLAASAAPFDELAGIGVETRTFTGEPAPALHELAAAEGVDAIVVGSPHRGAIGRAFIGSVAESLLHGAVGAVAVAPRDYAARARATVDVVGIAYDGTPESKQALKQAESLALAAGAKLRVLTVLAPAVPMPGVVGYTPPLGFDPEELIEEAIAAVGPGLETDGVQLAGPPASALAEACADGVDLLCSGSRGQGPVGRVAVGSVGSKLICKAPCPVLVVPRAKARVGEAARG